MTKRIRRPKPFYLAIHAWQGGYITDTQLDMIYKHVSKYCNSLLVQHKFALYLMQNQTISEGDLWIHLSKEIKHYDVYKASFNTWLFNQYRTLLRNETRKEVRHYEKKELNNKAGEWLDTNKRNVKHEFNYEQFDKALDDKELDRLYNTLDNKTL